MPSQQPYHEVTLEDFAKAFGTTVGDIPDDCKDLIAKTDFRYKKYTDKERDNIILNVIKKIESGDLKVSGKKRMMDWEKGWSENLQNFIDSGYIIEALVPKYFRPNQLVRLKGDFVKPCNANFELNFSEVFRKWLFGKYLREVEYIYEFGCGTAQNLILLAKLFPQKKMIGLEWVDASREIINLLKKHFGYNIEFRHFDFYSPDESVDIRDNSAVLTFGALEQIGCDYEPFLQFLLRKSPKICINAECLIELYDENNLIDYLAIMNHKNRKYLDGYLTRLQQLEDEGAIRIQKVKRLFFGSLLMEAYSYIVWEPCKRQ